MVILGSTGSIGTQALDLVRATRSASAWSGSPPVVATATCSRRQVEEFSPAHSGLGEQASTEVAAQPCDVVLNGITGAVGLRPTLAALEAGTTLALANKESLIMGGPLVLDRAAARPDRGRSTPSTARWRSACEPVPPTRYAAWC